MQTLIAFPTLPTRILAQLSHTVCPLSLLFADGGDEDPRAYAANAYLGMLAQWQTKQQQQAAALAAVASGDFLSGGSVGVVAGGGDKAAAALPDMLVQVSSQR